MNIVVVGGGIAGTRIAKQLDALLITESKEFVFPPLLPDALRGIQAKRPYKHKNILYGRVTKILPEKQAILVNNKRVTYDLLVVATGARAFTNLKGIQEHAQTFYTYKDLEKTKQLLKKETAIIVGAGPTGVELAMELAPHLQITLLQRDETILPTFHPHTQQYAQKKLSEAGVKIRRGTHCTKVTNEGVTTTEGTISADIVFWTAGVQANLVEGLPAKHGFLVKQTLQSKDYPNVFVVGDAAQTGNPLTAQVAIEEAKHATKNIKRYLKKKPLKPFTYKHRGMLLGLGDEAYLESHIHLKGKFVAWMRRTYYNWQFKRA